MSAPVSSLVDASGRPVSSRLREDRACPRCRGTKRVASGGFGVPHAICSTCGWEWPDEPFIAEESH